MNTTYLDKIVIKPNRQRQEFDPAAMQELKNSIEDRGLLHPPVCRREGEQIVLVAGERRLKAIEEIYALGGNFSYNGAIFTNGALPYTDLGSLPPLEAEEAELDENLRRKDLTWQELASAQERLHNLRTAQKLQTGAPAQTVADTAEELTGRRDGYFQDTVRTNILVAKHLDNPLIAKAKSSKEAFKILKAAETRQQNIEKAKEIGSSVATELHTLLQGDCLEILKQARFQSRFDVICTDPPYGMGAESFGDGAGRYTAINHEYSDDLESWKTLMADWAKIITGCAKPLSHLYAFCDIDQFHWLKQLLAEEGWNVFRTPLTLVKNNGRVPLPEHGPRRVTEWVLYAFQGKKPVTHIYPDAFQANSDDNLGHGAQKPIAAIQNLLVRSVRPGDEILDPFAGTGTILPAGHGLACKVTAIEKDLAYFAVAQKRLAGLTAEGEILKGLA